MAFEVEYAGRRAIIAVHEGGMKFHISVRFR